MNVDVILNKLLEVSGDDSSCKEILQNIKVKCSSKLNRLLCQSRLTHHITNDGIVCISKEASWIDEKDQVRKILKGMV